MSVFQEHDHLKIPLEHIKLATDDFSDNNLLGQGGFGRVYKGQLPLSDDSATSSTKPGTTVAVKRLDDKFGQGQPEFLKEIVMLASYKHDNIVSLVGFCEEGDEKIIVYKHELHGSLDKHLVSRDLTWEHRLQICLTAARGLNYLHNDVAEGYRIVHRDIKSSNILLDENWEAKISDFGLSKIGLTNQGFSYLVTSAAGTLGYVDPQYVETGVLTKESDVYSFGVVLFEVLCGRLALGELRHLAKLRYEEGKLDEIILPNLRNQMKPGSLQTFSRIAYQCLQKDRKQRPTMGLIIEELQTSLEFQTSRQRMRQIRLWGSSTGGSPWSLQLSKIKKLRKITLDHEDWIYSIGFTTEDLISDSLHSSYQQHGGSGGRSGGKISEITFDADEEITGILGTVGVSTGNNAGFTVISSLSFVTNKKTHGFFGKETGTCFSVSCDIGSFKGFYGRSGFYLDGLGCYLQDIL